MTSADFAEVERTDGVSQRLWMIAVTAGATLSFEALRAQVGLAMAGASPGELYAGIALRPFQLRELIPLLAHLFAWLPGQGADHTGAFRLLEAGATAGLLFATLALLRRFGAHPSWILALAVMLLANYVLAPDPVWFQPYDLPAVMFATLGLSLLHGRRWPAFYLVLAIALVNRETAAALVWVFALTYWGRMPWRLYAGHLAAQMALVAAIKGTLAFIFRHSPGEAMSFWDANSGAWRLVQNIRFLGTWGAATAFGGLWLPFLVALPRLRDPFLRRAVWVIPPFLAGMLLVGNFCEFRIFGELLPLMLVVMATSFSTLTRDSIGGFSK